MDKALNKYLLVDNERLEKEIRMEDGRQGKPKPLKKLTIVGILQHELSINTFDFQVLTQSSFTVPITFKSSNPDISLIHSRLIEISNLKLKNDSSFPILTTTKKSKIKLIESQDLTTSHTDKAQDNLKQGQKDLDSDTHLWKVLIMPLHNYALSTTSGLKFELKSLLNISEKVSFTGILISVEPVDSHSGLSSNFKLRDTLTNDTLSIFVSYNNSEHMKSYLACLALCDTMMVDAFRMISKRLSIYCKLTLKQDFSNFKRIKVHNSACFELECPCKFMKGRFTSYFPPYSLIFEIKPSILFRPVIKLHLRPIYLNCIKTKEMCENCQFIGIKKDNKCCENPKIIFNILASFIAEDSSGVAECEISKLSELQILFGFDDQDIQEYSLLPELKIETVLKYQDFSERVKRKLKNLKPQVKNCIGKVRVKAGKENLVSLNSDYIGNDISFKILKVID